MVVGRLAPTPSGHLHLGNALAFGAAWLSVRRQGGRLLLRLEDLDRGRARPEVAEAQRQDLLWLGLDWDEEVPAQGTRDYDLSGIPAYRCACNRATRLAGACPCRAAPAAEGVLRFRVPGGEVRFTDRARGPKRFRPDDDPVIRRRDGEVAYPAAVVIDDARDGITEVVRGADLLEATATQLALHRVLGLSPPSYLHVPVLLGPDGTKLAKRHGSTELEALRAAGWTPDDVWAALLPLLGQPPGPLANAGFDPARIPAGPFTVDAQGRVRR